MCFAVASLDAEHFASWHSEEDLGLQTQVAAQAWLVLVHHRLLVVHL